MRTTIFLFILICISACTPLKPGTKTTKPKTNRPRTERPTTTPNVGKMDTLVYTPPSPTTPPPIQTGGTKPPVKANTSTYKVAMLLPFLTNKFDQVAGDIPNKSDYALHFYSGAKLAAEQLSIEEPSLKMQIDVLDSYLADDEFRKNLNKPSVQNADLFIGPIRGSHIAILGKSMPLNHKPIISPFTPSENILTSYPEYIQLNPSLRMHCEVMANYVLAQYGAEQIVLVGREKEKDRFAYFQNIAQSKGNSAFRQIVEADDATTLKTNLKPYINSIKPTIFLVPSWSSESFINAFLRELKSVKGRSQVFVYGMPQWEDFERIEDELFQANQVRLISSSYIDLTSPAVQDFQRKFIEEYGTVPNKYAYDGYDTMYWTGKMLAKFGKNFAQANSTELVHGLRTNIQLESIGRDTGYGQKEINYKENKRLFILGFQENQFKPIIND